LCKDGGRADREDDGQRIPQEQVAGDGTVHRVSGGDGA
jgi:hypothetical protein